MVQPRKRAGLADVTANTHQEGATEQNQSTEGGYLAPIETSISSAKGYPIGKSPRLPVTCNQSVAHSSLDSLTGDVYNLTTQDAETVAKSDQIWGQIWLTIPYNQGSPPFITISISRFLSYQFARRRAQIM